MLYYDLDLFLHFDRSQKVSVDPLIVIITWFNKSNRLAMLRIQFQNPEHIQRLKSANQQILK